MVKVIWLRNLTTDELKCFEFNGYNDTLKIGDYISNIQIGHKTDKNDFGREIWSTHNIYHNDYRVEMIKGFDDFDSFSYYCDIHKQWSYIKSYEWIRQEFPRDVIYKYLHSTDISDSGKNIIYQYKENFYNYEDFISAIRDDLDNVTINQGEERMDIDNYVIVRFPDRWGNFNKDSKTYLFTATEIVFKNLEIGSIIGIIQTYDTKNGLQIDYYKDKKIRVEAKFCCSKKNVVRLPQFNNFEEIYIKEITLHKVFSETFTSEELTRISCEFDFTNASYSYKIYGEKNTLYLKTFSEVVEYITKQRAARFRPSVVLSEEGSNIVSTTSSPMSISVDNSNNLSIEERFKALDEKIENTLKKLLKKEAQKNEEVYIPRIERIIAESDFVVPFGNEKGTFSDSTEETTIIDAETMEPYNDNTLIKAGTAYYRYTCSKHPVKIQNNNNNNNKERKFMNIFKNFNFGELKTPSIACSFKGIAFKGTDGSYCVYDIDTNEAINVSDFVVDVPLYTIPVSRDNLKKGDIILHRNCFYIVKVNGASTFEAIDPLGGTIQFLVPEKSIFGFNYYTKVVSPFSMMNSTASEDNPFGNMLPFLFMNNKENNEDFKYLMMFSLMGNKDTNMNQMLPFLLMSDNKEMNPMTMMMLMQNFNSDIALVPKENNNEDMSGIKQELAEIKATLTQFNDIINEA